MSLKFDNLMKKFYADPQLGIGKVEEDAPANNASSGAVSMPPDAKMKKKKSIKFLEQWMLTEMEN